MSTGQPIVRDTRFLLWLALITGLAFVVRENFVLTTVVDIPIRGDIREYVAYAWNLVHHHVFSFVAPQATSPPPDAYRSPGYPWLIAACMALRPHGDWYALALQVQVLLGTATVALTALLGRQWLPAWAALFAAALLALWPHHIVASGTLLSEVLFGFTLTASLYLFGRRSFSLAGASFGFSFLVNPLIGLFPPVLALLFLRRGNRRRMAIFLMLFLFPAGIWALRSTSLEADTGGRTGRLAMNLVQGSWPLYHDAYRDSFGDNPIPKAIMRQINSEAQLLTEEPIHGLTAIGKRLRLDPAMYATWYIFKKPWLLWDWNIRIGFGGPYFLVMRNSPLERIPVMRTISQGYRAINPVLTLLLATGTLLIAASSLRRTPPPIGAISTMLLALYLTALHAALQAEPRYATAYRGIEALMVASACAWLLFEGMRVVGSKRTDRRAVGPNTSLSDAGLTK